MYGGRKQTGPRSQTRRTPYHCTCQYNKMGGGGRRRARDDTMQRESKSRACSNGTLLHLGTERHLTRVWPTSPQKHPCCKRKSRHYVHVKSTRLSLRHAHTNPQTLYNYLALFTLRCPVGFTLPLSRGRVNRYGRVPRRRRWKQRMGQRNSQAGSDSHDQAREQAQRGHEHIGGHLCVPTARTPSIHTSNEESEKQ